MDVLTLHQVADELGVHYMTAYRYVRLGMLPAHREGREWRVRRDDLEAMREGTAGQVSADGAPWDERLLSRLIEGDEGGAWWVVEAALAAGASPQDVLLRVITPALHQIGEGWADGRLGVDGEHLATGIVHRLLGRLGGRFARRGPDRGTVLLGTTPDELHGLPLAIAAEFLRLAGFHAVNLGPRLPTTAFVDSARGTPRLVAVGVGVSAPGQDEELRSTVAALKRAVDVPVIVGGSAVKTREAAIDFGADEWAASVEDLLPILGVESGR